jgi:cytochrome c oxidase assembly factor CtaG
MGRSSITHFLQIVMHTSLFLSALWFWWTLLRLPLGARWQAIPILLLTGKFACLLATLLIFAPRVLYDVPIDVSAVSHHWTSTNLNRSRRDLARSIGVCPASPPTP